MRKSKKWTCILLAGAVSVSLLTGCGSPGDGADPGQASAEERETVTIALWSDQLTENYCRYLQDTFPDVDFEFYVATNSTDFYQFKNQSQDLPDILTVRRFSLNDVAPWKDALMDLSDSELANTFHQSYLRSYTYSDGTVNWLPACAEVDGILVNRSLLEEHHIPIPANYQEFMETCASLKELGIRPFTSNFSADYTCMEILQGLSVSCLTSQKGREWRQQYESGQINQLSEEVWLPVFEHMQELIDQAGLGPEDLETDTPDVFGAYQRHETAMIRGTCNEASVYGVAEDSVMMPYYGETEEENWYLTYPAFQVAASARAEEDPGRRELIFDIMEAMLNEEGLRHIATGQDMIAYNKGVELELSPILAPMPDYIEENRLYIRLASSDMFSVSRQIVQKMITGEYPDARSAFDAFNDAMRTEKESAPAAAQIETGYSYSFDPDGGSPAASAVMNSLREELGVQILAGQSVNVAGNIAAGDYTEQELRFLIMGESIDVLQCTMTGEQMFDYLNYALSTHTHRGSVVNDSSLYVSSGFEMEVQKTDEGYQLERLTMNGQEMDPKETYSTVVLGNEILMLKAALEAAGVTEYTRVDASCKQLLVDRLAGGRQLAGPSDYITLR